MDLNQKLAKLPISRDGERAARFQVEGRATVTLQESSLKFECAMRNISRTGLLVLFSGHVQRPLEPGETVQLMMEPIPYLFGDPIICRASVARMLQYQTEDQTVWHIGLKFDYSPA
jgi:hypothetical protein